MVSRTAGVGQFILYKIKRAAREESAGKSASQDRDGAEATSLAVCISKSVKPNSIRVK